MYMCTKKSKQFTGYSEVVRLTYDFMQFKTANPAKGVREYVQERHITAWREIEGVCKVARRLGYNTYRRGNVWYEDGIEIASI